MGAVAWADGARALTAAAAAQQAPLLAARSPPRGGETRALLLSRRRCAAAFGPTADPSGTAPSSAPAGADPTWRFMRVKGTQFTSQDNDAPWYFIGTNLWRASGPAADAARASFLPLPLLLRVSPPPVLINERRGESRFLAHRSLPPPPARRYGANLGSAGARGDRRRLLAELDSLQALGVSHVRILGASEGPDTEPWRMAPALMPCPVRRRRCRGPPAGSSFAPPPVVVVAAAPRLTAAAPPD